MNDQGKEALGLAVKALDALVERMKAKSAKRDFGGDYTVVAFEIDDAIMVVARSTSAAILRDALKAYGIALPNVVSRERASQLAELE